MDVKKVVVGCLETNCYIISNNENCLIIDPGDDYEKIIKNIDKQVDGILITHNHFDHVGAKQALEKHYNVKSYDFNNLKEGYVKIDDFKFEVIYTKGHTADSISYLFDNVMFVGDFIFKNSIGRTDLETGDYNEMLKSIEKIKKYDRNITLFPGHYDSTTLVMEINNNPFLN